MKLTNRSVLPASAVILWAFTSFAWPLLQGKLFGESTALAFNIGLVTATYVVFLWSVYRNLDSIKGPPLLALAYGLSTVLLIFTISAQLFPYHFIVTSGDKPMEVTGCWDLFYYCTVTFTTVGYGDVVPAANIHARIYATFIAIIGSTHAVTFLSLIFFKFSAPTTPTTPTKS